MFDFKLQLKALLLRTLELFAFQQMSIKQKETVSDIVSEFESARQRLEKVIEECENEIELSEQTVEEAEQDYAEACRKLELKHNKVLDEEASSQAASKREIESAKKWVSVIPSINK